MFLVSGDRAAATVGDAARRLASSMYTSKKKSNMNTMSGRALLLLFPVSFPFMLDPILFV